MSKHNDNKPIAYLHLHKSVLAALSVMGATGMIPAQASLTSSAVLQFDAGVQTCVLNDCQNFGSNVTAGSWFAMDANNDGLTQNGEKWGIATHNGIHIGFSSTASGSHSGLPFGAANNYTGTHLIQIGINPTDGSPVYVSDGDGNLVTLTTTEMPGVDEPWGFFGNTGMHYLTKAVTVVNDVGTRKWLDFSGWTITWNGILAIPETNGAWGAGTGYFNNGNGNGNGVARIQCSTSSCSHTSSFTLDYFATVPNFDPSGFGNVKYQLHLEGNVSGVPVPAAVWLFGSGLAGLAGVLRRRKRASG